MIFYRNVQHSYRNSNCIYVTFSLLFSLPKNTDEISMETAICNDELLPQRTAQLPKIRITET